MSSAPAVAVAGLSKRYALDHRSLAYGTLRDTLASLFRGDRQRKEEFWALRDVSFEVAEGDVVGILGRNGAGKSTLLKILSRITQPTHGRAVIRGRVASLLEVGTGFHQELTGRENIFLCGAILGMRRRDILRRMDEIIAFSGVERFLDTSLKHYSSGMQLRLAFAVAAHLEPEILLIDEVLAVGDVEFQRKCMGKMEEVARAGRTILFVSHNMAALELLCETALYLEDGSIKGFGPTAAQVQRYLEDTRAQPSASTLPLSEHTMLEYFGLTPNPLRSGDDLEFTLEVRALEEVKIRSVVILLESLLGLRIAIVDLRHSSGGYLVPPGARLNLSGTLRGVNLVEGEYQGGLYFDGDLIARNFHGLTALTVRPRAEGELTPYKAADRGLVEFACRFDAIVKGP